MLFSSRVRRRLPSWGEAKARTEVITRERVARSAEARMLCMIVVYCYFLTLILVEVSMSLKEMKM